MSEQPDSPSMIDWDLAVRIGSRFAGDGPEISRAEADERGRRAAGGRRPVHRAGPRLHRPDRRRAHRTGAGRRPAGWVQANADGFATILTPLVDKLADKKGRPGPVGLAVGSRVTGAEVGLLLGFLGSRVLGQFDPFHEPTRAGCCWSPPTSSTSSASSASTPPTSGSGSACTRRPTGCSSPRSPGCATTSAPRSPTSPTPSSRPACSRTASSGSPGRSAATAAASST